MELNLMPQARFEPPRFDFEAATRTFSPDKEFTPVDHGITENVKKKVYSWARDEWGTASLKDEYGVSYVFGKITNHPLCCGITVFVGQRYSHEVINKLSEEDFKDFAKHLYDYFCNASLGALQLEDISYNKTDYPKMKNLIPPKLREEFIRLGAIEGPKFLNYAHARPNTVMPLWFIKPKCLLENADE